MLLKFKALNKKFHNGIIEIDFTSTKPYNFSEMCLNKDGDKKVSMIYCGNSFGKSTLINHIYDIKRNLVKPTNIKYYDPSDYKDTTNFYYQFKFNGSIVEYEYTKDIESNIILIEKLVVENDLIFHDVGGFNSSFVGNGVQNGYDFKDNKQFKQLKSYLTNIMLFKATDFYNKESDLYRMAVEHYPQFRKVNKHFEYYLPKNLNDFIKIESNSFFELFIQYFIERNNYNLVLIDELNSSKDRHLIMRIVGLCGQLIATSSNSELISNDILRPDCYYIVNKNACKTMMENTEKELREAHNLRKMYIAGRF